MARRDLFGIVARRDWLCFKECRMEKRDWLCFDLCKPGGREIGYVLTLKHNQYLVGIGYGLRLKHNQPLFKRKRLVTLPFFLKGNQCIFHRRFLHWLTLIDLKGNQCIIREIHWLCLRP